ncbi:hypothetical protein AVEN_75967-1 [Araneus ventricosus]|uniref:Uncharacterized protein n=1 Tax=Araneus ventricosus TaxID=182803 RepID=A0A4Y2RS57_ARAVE|nr:hypothetical protein AVEN_75967-1 [Araneus ventricosus]
MRPLWKIVPSQISPGKPDSAFVALFRSSSERTNPTHSARLNSTVPKPNPSPPLALDRGFNPSDAADTHNRKSSAPANSPGFVCALFYCERAL